MLRSRPFATVEELRRTLPFRVARTRPGLEVPKLDINSVGEEELASRLGVAPEVAGAIVSARPFYSMEDLRRVPGLDDASYDLLTSVFAAQPLTYVDKLTGRTVNLTADTSKVLVEFGQTEGAERSLRRGLRLRDAAPPSADGTLRVFHLPETESSGETLSQLKDEPGVEKVVPAFRDQGEHERFLDPEYGTVQFDPATPVERQDEILSRLGLELEHRYRSPGLVTVRIPSGKTDPSALVRAIQALNSLPEVKLAEPNYLGFDDRDSASGNAADSPSGLSWNLQLIGVPDAWAYGKGSDRVVIAVVDSGVDESHPVVRDALLPRQDADDWNFIQGEGPSPVDDEGHGTFIAGLLGGNGQLGVQGICPGCRILPLRIPLSGERTSYASRADAILYALERVPAGKRLVFNLSWKTTGDVSVVRLAITQAVSRGAIVVSSAGNGDDVVANQQHFPSDYPDVISVAAVGPDRRRALYSFYGQQVDLAAPGGTGDPDKPGEDIRSAAIGGSTGVSAGTSFAAPHVAAVAALLLSQDPTLSAQQVREALQSTATPLAEAGLGRGLVNAAAAVRSVSTQPSQPARPSQPGSPKPAENNSHLIAVNTDDIDSLMRRFDLKRITARHIIAKRPINDLTRIRGTLGLTEQQFARITSHSTPLPAQELPADTFLIALHF